MEKKEILVTGGAGFIGSAFVGKLLANDYKVTAIDNFDPFYDRGVKEKNIAPYLSNPDFTFYELDIVNRHALQQQLTGKYAAIVHLAAKAGVRPSIENPIPYQEVNVGGTQNVLEFAKTNNIKQFVFASSSSVYGINKNVPWKETDTDLNPISPYASTKISGELLGHVYSHLYGIRFIVLRFFTVYGPGQRPDLAIHLFGKKISNGEPINVFGDGNTRRDYTYIGDIVEGVYNALHYTQSNYEVINLGNHQTVSLAEMISCIEEVFEKKAVINRLPEQMGDVPVTFADITKARRLLNYHPATDLKTGIKNFKEWFIAQ